MRSANKETMEPIVFDSERIIALKLRTADGDKTVRVRFPSDAEWIKRQKLRKIIVKQLGRGKSQTTVTPCEDSDLKLVAAIRVEDTEGPEIDKFEASFCVEQLATAKVEDVVDEPGGFAVTLRTVGGVTVHHLKMPSEQDKADYRSNFAKPLDLPFDRQEITVNIGAASDVYKRLCISTEGYKGSVPIIHQSAALQAAINAQEAPFAEDQTEDF